MFTFIYLDIHISILLFQCLLQSNQKFYLYGYSQWKKLKFVLSQRKYLVNNHSVEVKLSIGNSFCVHIQIKIKLKNKYEIILI